MRRESLPRLLAKAWDLAVSCPTSAYRLGCRCLGLPCPAQIYYVVPAAGWVTDWIGYYITSQARNQFGLRVHLTSAPHLLRGHLIHYGELGTFLASLGKHRNRHNTIVVTIFHGSCRAEFPELRERTEHFVKNMQVPARIVTACQIMEQRLTTWGASADQVVRIPLGVDRSLFRPASADQRQSLRRSMGIPDNAFCIGSFQKDGQGWREGLAPKLIKGPDVFLKVIARLHAHYKLFVLLTAPARGYVKQGLSSLGVPYRHMNMSDYRRVASLYQCLDLYLVTSREEGGPKAVLESLASGVPLVSTRVGLAPDVIEHGRNGFLAEPEDVNTLAEHVALLIEQPELHHELTRRGREIIKAYDWSRIAAQYYRQIYRPLLAQSDW